MNVTVWKDLLREIQKTFPRFLSIIAIVALGVAFFIGIKSAGPSMIKTSQTYFQENNLPHGHVLGTYGLDQDDMSRLDKVDLDWLPMTTVRTSLQPGDLSVKIFPTIKKQEANFFKVSKGRFPKKIDEIALDSQVLSFYNETSDQPINLGDWVEISPKEIPEQGQPSINQKKFKVVGFVETPIYFERKSRGNEPIDIFALASESVIEGSVYTEAYFWRKDLRQVLAYTDQWEDKLAETKQDIEAVLKDQGSVKLTKISQEAEREIKEQQKKLDDGYKELDKGQEKIQQKGHHLTSASNDLILASQRLEEAQIEFDKGRWTYQSGLELYQNGIQEISDNEAQLVAFQASYDQGLAQYQLAESLMNGDFTDYADYLRDNPDLLESLIKDSDILGDSLGSGSLDLDNLSNHLGSSLGSDLPEGMESLQILESLMAVYPEEYQRIQNQIQALKEEISTDSAFEPSPMDRIQELESQREKLVGQIEALLNQAVYDDETSNEDEISSQDPAPFDQSQIDNLMTELEALDASLLEAYEELKLNEEDLDTDQVETQLQYWMDQLERLNQESLAYDQEYQQWKDRIQTYIQEQDNLSEALSDYQLNLEQLEKAGIDLKTVRQVINKQMGLDPILLESASLELQEGQFQLQNGWNALAQGRQELAVAAERLKAAKEQLDAGQLSLDQGRLQLDSGIKEYNQGYSLFESASKAFQNQYQSVIKDLESGQAEINQARNRIKKLLTPEFMTKLSQEDSAYVSVHDNAQQLDVISNIFPVFFLLIAILVTFTTVKRMTFEQRNFMGTLKQMGYLDATIMKKFIVYAGSASLIGTSLGLMVGYIVFPNVILSAYNIMYIFEKPVVYYSVFWMIVISLISLATGLIPAIASPIQILKEAPAQLLRPPAPRTGKKTFIERISFIWNRLSFKKKMTIRNLLRYKGRNLMTLLGVAGCTMLIVTGYGISNTISGIIDQQFNRIQTFDAILVLKEDLTLEDVGEIDGLLKQSNQVKEFIPIHQKTIETKVQGISNQTVNVVVPMSKDTQTFEKYIHLHERENPDKTLSLKSGQIFITERLEEFVNTKSNNLLSVDYEGLNRDVKISHVLENYIGHYMYMSLRDYQDTFLTEPKINAYYLAFNSDDSMIIKNQMMANNKVLTFLEIESLASGIQNSLGSLDLITLVLIISAAGLAFIVLYNLTNINIEERMKELATIKVLGFYSHEVSLYIYDEILILTILGSLCGLGFGYGLTHFIMKTMQLNNVLFYPRVHLESYLFSCFFTFVFSALVMGVMHRRIRRIDMVEALKAVE